MPTVKTVDYYRMSLTGQKRAHYVIGCLIRQVPEAVKQKKAGRIVPPIAKAV